MKLKIEKIYTFEPGKNSPLPPIPTSEKSLEKDNDDKLENNLVEENGRDKENLNEFILSPVTEKRSSVNIIEKKLLQEALAEENNKIDNQNSDKGIKIDKIIVYIILRLIM